MAKKSKSTAASHAVYRGQDVKLFDQDLSNYAQLRRGLSPAMRQQTLTKEQLRKVSPDIVISYINALNEWRQSPQRGKIVRGQSKEISRLEDLFRREIESGYFGENDVATLATANLKMKSMTQENARREIREALNAVDRAHMGDWYRPEDYWINEYYMSHDAWDPTMASDSMLRLAIQYGMVDEYPEIKAATRQEYADRLGDSADPIMATQTVSGHLDILATAKLFTRGAV